MTTSSPRCFRCRPSRSIAKVFPAPGVAPRYTLRRPCAAIIPEYFPLPACGGGSGWGLRRPEAIASTGHGLDHLGVRGIVLELDAQSLDEHTEVVSLVAVGRTPYLVQQAAIVHDLVSVAGEFGQQQVFRRRKPHLGALSGNRSGSQVDEDAVRPDSCGGIIGWLHRTQDGTDTGQELFCPERLGQVVIGPHVERADLVLLIASGTDDDYGWLASVMHFPKHAPSIDERKADIEQDDLRVRRP